MANLVRQLLDLLITKSHGSSQDFLFNCGSVCNLVELFVAVSRFAASSVVVAV